MGPRFFKTVSKTRLNEDRFIICPMRNNGMLKELGAKAFSYGYASPVLMATTYNDDGTVNDR